MCAAGGLFDILAFFFVMMLAWLSVEKVIDHIKLIWESNWVLCGEGDTPKVLGHKIA